MKYRFQIMDITVESVFPGNNSRYRIRYFDSEKPQNKYNTVTVEINMFGSPDHIDVLQKVAENASVKIGEPLFYEAMREYVFTLMTKDKYGNFSLSLGKPPHMNYNFAEKAKLPLKSEEYQPAKMKFKLEQLKKDVAAEKEKISYKPKKSNHVSGSAFDYYDEIEDELGGLIAKKNPAAAIKPPLASGLDLNQIDLLPGLNERVKHPVSGKLLPIKDIIINLNDDQGWSREKVADWLETLDVDLRFKSEADKLREREEKERKNKIAELKAKLDAANKQIQDFADKMAQLQVQCLEFDLQIQSLMEEENG